MSLFGMEIEPWMALAAIGVIMVVVCIVGLIVYKIVDAKEKKESFASLPQGADQTETSRMLQEKYRAERDSGEFTRNF